MQTRQVFRNTVNRFRPSRLGAIPLFLALLVLVRWSMGEPLVPERPALLLAGALYLSIFYAFSPWPWQWTGDTRHRTGIIRGWVQALVWNLTWLGLLSLIHRYHRGPEPQHIASGMASIAQQARLPLEIVRLIIQMPFTILLGWFVAEKEASELDWAESERQRRLLEEHMRESEAQSLRAQLDPHVLYNALGALSELARENPVATEEALLDFSDLYRRLTVLRERPFISLGDERELLERYLAIETIRLGRRLKIEWEWPPELDHVRVPPLLVLPLVENAIKHGIAPEKSGGTVKIGVQSPEGNLEFRIANTGKPMSLDPSNGGLGLRNLRARLRLLGSGSSQVDLRSEKEWTVANLHLAKDVLGVPA